MPVQIDEITTQVQTVPPEGSPDLQTLAHQIAERIVAMMIEEMRIEAERKRAAGMDRVRVPRRGGRS